ILEQEALYIEKLEQSLKQYKSASNLDDDGTMDRQDMSQANEAKDMQMRLRVQLDKANKDFTEFKKVGNENYSTVESGALVSTEKAYFFVGVSLHTLTVEGKELFGVSGESPAFKTMYGKVKNDEFSLGDTKYKIIEIE
ncbi:MAG: hypothetical protein ABI861_11565, partial [Panacibacter sp.]